MALLTVVDWWRCGCYSPALRSANDVDAFNAEFAAAGHDLDRWLSTNRADRAAGTVTRAAVGVTLAEIRRGALAPRLPTSWLKIPGSAGRRKMRRSRRGSSRRHC